MHFSLLHREGLSPPPAVCDTAILPSISLFIILRSGAAGHVRDSRLIPKHTRDLTQKYINS